MKLLHQHLLNDADLLLWRPCQSGASSASKVPSAAVMPSNRPSPHYRSAYTGNVPRRTSMRAVPTASHSSRSRCDIVESLRHFYPEPHESRLSGHTTDATDIGLLRIRYYGYLIVTLYHESRTHLSLNKDSPDSRSVQSVGRIISFPEVGGL